MAAVSYLLNALAVEHAEVPVFSSSQIKLGHYYTNNQHGDANKDMVIYRVVEGQGLRSANSCTRIEFAKWAARELFPTHTR